MNVEVLSQEIVSFISQYVWFVNVFQNWDTWGLQLGTRMLISIVSRRWFFLFLPFWMRWGSEFSWNPIFFGGGEGSRWVCFWMHFFLQIFEHFSSTPIPPWGVEVGYGWRWGEGGVFLESFLEFLRGGTKGMGGERLSTYTQTHYRLD